jgi:hypothetical protein
VEWFKLSKQRAAVRPEVPAEAIAPAEQQLIKADRLLDAAMAAASKISIAKIPSPKTVFDHPAKAGVKPTAKVGFTISSSKNGESSELQLTSPTLTVAKARMLFKSGWRVHITNAAGRQFAPSEFDEILKFD